MKVGVWVPGDFDSEDGICRCRTTCVVCGEYGYYYDHVDHKITQERITIELGADESEDGDGGFYTQVIKCGGHLDPVCSKLCMSIYEAWVESQDLEVPEGL